MNNKGFTNEQSRKFIKLCMIISVIGTIIAVICHIGERIIFKNAEVFNAEKLANRLSSFMHNNE